MADYSNSAIPRNDNIAIMTNDIRQTLGLPNTTINNRFGRLCVHENVNMFSLKKPVHLTTDTPDRTNDNWCKGYGENYGIKMPEAANIDQLDKSKWIYERPINKYRLYDFVGYMHKAPKPYYKIPSEMYTNKDLQKNKATSCYPFSTATSVGFDKYSTQMKDAPKKYAAIWVRDDSNDGGYIKTHHLEVSGGEDNTEFDLHGLPEKYTNGVTLRVCVFLTNTLQVDWISATKLPLGFLAWGGYDKINYTTYVSKFVAPAELSTELVRDYTFIDSAEPIEIRIRNIRNDGKSVDIRNGVDTSKVRVHYEVDSATGETAKADNYACTIVSGSGLIAPNQSCIIRFDKMLGYTENGQSVFPPPGFSGWCYATLYYDRTNDLGGSEKFILGNFNIRLIGSGI